MDLFGVVVDVDYLFVVDVLFEFCCDDDFVMEWFECFVDEFFVDVRIVDFCGVEEVYVVVDC